MRMTIDFHDNELKMSAFLTDKYAEILQKMGATQVVKQPRKGPYDVTDYQTSHLCGGAIMGEKPDNSAVNRYLQSWDVPNLFVVGARVSAECRLQPDRHRGSARLLVSQGHSFAIPQESRTAHPCVGSGHHWSSRASAY